MENSIEISRLEKEWSLDDYRVSRRILEACYGTGAAIIAVLTVDSGASWVEDFLLFSGAILGLAAIRWFWPTLDRSLLDQPMACLIAFVGCDGSGKSTLTSDLRNVLGSLGPVQLCYLGLGSGAIGETIKRVPLVGRLVERRLATKAAQARTRGRKIPGLPTALTIYIFSLVRLRRFKRMLRLRRAGVAVLTDRYPQIECPGFYDGPGLSAASPGSRLVALIARQERRLYDFMVAFRPDIVIRLNVDVDTAHARKPDHRRDLLEQKVAVTARLRFSGAPVVDVDATQPYRRVLATASRIVQSITAVKTPLAWSA